MFVSIESKGNEEIRKTALAREDTRRKCGQTIIVKIE